MLNWTAQCGETDVAECVGRACRLRFAAVRCSGTLVGKRYKQRRASDGWARGISRFGWAMPGMTKSGRWELCKAGPQQANLPIIDNMHETIDKGLA